MTSIFEKAKKLFIKKWQHEEAFISYLNEMWLTSHATWYEGFFQNGPSTNNALESFNLVIKKEETLREKMPLSRFTTQCFNMISGWSQQYSRGKQIITEPSIELAEWTQAYHWVKQKKDVSTKNKSNGCCYYLPAGDKSASSAEEIKQATQCRWTSFDQFSERAFGVWVHGHW